MSQPVLLQNPQLLIQHQPLDAMWWPYFLVLQQSEEVPTKHQNQMNVDKFVQLNPMFVQILNAPQSCYRDVQVFLNRHQINLKHPEKCRLALLSLSMDTLLLDFLFFQVRIPTLLQKLRTVFPQL